MSERIEKCMFVLSSLVSEHDHYLPLAGDVISKWKEHCGKKSISIPLSQADPPGHRERGQDMRDKRNKERYGIMCYRGRDKQRERDRGRDGSVTARGAKVVPQGRWNEI